jgi:hypothetical protein
LWSTKATILEELIDRISSGNYMQMVVDSPGFIYIWELLGSPDPRVRSSSCKLLGNLAYLKLTLPPILEMRGCERLVALLE